MKHVRKVIITLIGVVFSLLGLVLLVLPGPGLLFLFIGLSVLGAEYAWARARMRWLRHRLSRIGKSA